MEIALEPPYLIVKPFVSEDQFYRDADEDTNWEYLDGRLVMHSPASHRHEDVFSFFMTLVRGYLGVRPTAIVLGSRYPMRLDPRWSPEPDLLVVRRERRHLLTPARLEGPADFVVEIASDSDPGLDLREKLPRYRDAGIDAIWLVNRFERHVRTQTRQPTGYASRTLTVGRLESTVLSGFWIEVAWLWEPELPSPLDCLRAILGTL